MAKMVFSWGKVKYNALYSDQNDDNLYDICYGYIKLSMVFHPMAIFFGKYGK